MAFTPQFGGTNGVTELDAGQSGSTRRSGAKVWWDIQVRYGPPEMRNTLNAAPQQNVVFEDRLGWTGEVAYWTGQLAIKDATELASLRSVLNQYLTGSTINSTTGARGVVDTTYLKPTILTDAYGKALASRATVQRIIWAGNFARISGRTGYSFGNNLTIVFRILG